MKDPKRNIMLRHWKEPTNTLDYISLNIHTTLLSKLPITLFNLLAKHCESFFVVSSLSCRFLTSFKATFYNIIFTSQKMVSSVFFLLISLFLHRLQHYTRVVWVNARTLHTIRNRIYVVRLCWMKLNAKQRNLYNIAFHSVEKSKPRQKNMFVVMNVECKWRC